MRDISPNAIALSRPYGAPCLLTRCTECHFVSATILICYIPADPTITKPQLRSENVRAVAQSLQ
jgi:hypothetical protein